MNFSDPRRVSGALSLAPICASQMSLPTFLQPSRCRVNYCDASDRRDLVLVSTVWASYPAAERADSDGAVAAFVGPCDETL